MSTNADFAPTDFFVLRTPLLPFETLANWSEQAQAGANAEQDLAAQRSRLRAFLRQQFARPEVREALFVASPELDAAHEHWLADPDGEKGQRAERALVRYFVRMAGRATPFGLFAGGSVGTMGPETRLELPAVAQYQRHTRLDMDYLFALAETLNRDPAVQARLTYHPNSSLYYAAGRWRYAEARLNGKSRSYHLVAVEANDYLNETLARAQAGARPGELAAALVAADPEITQAEADDYLRELIDSQLLVSNLAPAVTGPEPIHGLLEVLRGETQPLAPLAVERLEQARDALAAIDMAGLGVETGSYQAIAASLSALPTPVESSRLFQVDMVKPVSQATLGQNVLDEIMRGVKLLHRLTQVRDSSALTRFREKFSQRYEGREAPLVEALDEEIGIGFDSASSAENAPLLEGLIFPPAPANQTVTWGKREQWLLRKLQEVWRTGAPSLELSKADVEALATAEPLPLPGAFSAMVSLAASSQDALKRGDFRVWLNFAGAPGARLLGRFCHADPALQRHVAQYLAAEEAHDPEAVWAEIVHLPEGRIGNVLCRPVLRVYEIPYLGHSGAGPECQLPISDLLVSLVNGRIVLRSQRLGRRVIPRLTSAHNFVSNSLGLYKFLGLVQNQGEAATLRWEWGAFESADFLPRVTSGRLVLSRAQWRVSRDEIRAFISATGNARFRAVQAWRAQRQLPRRLLLEQGDNLLPVDLDNVLNVEAFLDELKGRDEATLIEMFPGPDELSVSGPEGHFVHEIIVPFVPKTEPVPIPIAPRIEQRAVSAVAPRRFAPGSEWLYAKLYTGTATADQVLTQIVAPVTRAVMDAGAADHWFFIRYGDPDWHVRLRFHGDPARLLAEVPPLLQEACQPFLDDGRLWRVQFDTYEREVERYGGDAGMRLTERLFHADSEATLAILEMLEGDAGAEARWKLALRGMDMLLNDLDFDLAAKRDILRLMRDSFMREFRADSTLRSQLGGKQRHERQTLAVLLDPAHDEDSFYQPALTLFQRRSDQMAPVAATLRQAEHDGCLTEPMATLARSYLHMHANRLLRSEQRAQEMVLYDFLYRHYESLLGRGCLGS